QLPAGAGRRHRHLARLRPRPTGPAARHPRVPPHASGVRGGSREERALPRDAPSVGVAPPPGDGQALALPTRPAPRGRYAPASGREPRCPGPTDDGGTRAYWAVQPPSMTSSLPVTNAASSDARYRTP